MVVLALAVVAVSPTEARAWLGLPADASLSEQGEAVIACLADVPAPVPGDATSQLRTLTAFLAAANAAGLKPPRPKP